MISDLLDGNPLKTRCFCCGASSFADTAGGWWRCRWCDMYTSQKGHTSSDVRSAQLKALLRQVPTGQWPYPDWHPTYRTLKIAATSRSLWVCGTGHDLAVRVNLENDLQVTPFGEMPQRTVSLVVLAPPECGALNAFLEQHESYFHDTVVVVDGQKSGQQTIADVTQVAHPLCGDFGAQRNRGTAAICGEWAFHLDTDEFVDAAFCAALPHLAAAAETEGIRAIGLPRRNLVDGTLSDLFPDIQYRLIRRDVLFEGMVHERPETCQSGISTLVSQHGAIDHMLCRSRIRTRSQQYDRLGQERTRHADDRALMAPFRG